MVTAGAIRVPERKIDLAARVGLLGGKTPDMAEMVLFVAGAKIFLTVFVRVNEMLDVH